MRIHGFLLAVVLLAISAGAGLAALPLPPGMTPADVKSRMKQECSASSSSEECRRFSRVYHCRANYEAEACNKEREHFYCNVERYKDAARCDRLKRWNSGDRSQPLIPVDQDLQDNSNGTDGQYAGQQGGSTPLCQLTGTCGGGGGGNSSGGNSSGGNSSGGTVGGGPLTPPKLCIAPTNCNQNVTPGSFQSALNGANCGCSLTLGAGSYGNFSYTKNCPASNPVILKATGSGVRFGNITINGTGLTISGPEITGQVRVNGDYNRITRAAFTGDAEIDFIEGSSYNRIDHNDIIVNRQGVGETATFIAFYRPRSTAQMYQNNRIDSNYFTTNTPVPSASVPGSGIFLCMYGAQEGERHAKQFGSAKTMIENNLFENWGRKNAMEEKCSDNVFRNNTLVNTGRVLKRQGGRSLYENNWFQNMTTGLAIREFDNKVIGNYFEAAKLIIYKGERQYPKGECFQHRDWMPAGYQAPQGSPAVRTVIDNNSGLLVIGASEGGNKPCIVPVLQTRILSHKGPISRSNDVGTTGPTSTNALPPAKKLSRAQVGRGASEAGCN